MRSKQSLEDSTITGRVESPARANASSDSEPTLGSIYREHFDYVWRLLVAFRVAADDREDAAHDVFLVVERKLPNYDGSSAITTWLYGIVWRVAANVRRRSQRATRRYQPPAGPRAPDEDVELREAAQRVEEFLSGLSEQSRVLFELREIEQLPAQEIATRLELNPNTVYTRCRALRRRFRDFVDASMKGEPT